MTDNEFELPPNEVTNYQLYVLVSALRKDVVQLKTDNVTLRVENAELREEVGELTRKFDNAKAVTTSIKWMSGIALTLIGIFEAVRRFINP